ncbi:hypothetical protein Hanom_Chr04g00332941 [Helianthus anomalus]
MVVQQSSCSGQVLSAQVSTSVSAQSRDDLVPGSVTRWFGFYFWVFQFKLWVRVSVQRIWVTVHASGFGFLNQQFRFRSELVNGFGSVNISQRQFGSWFGLTRLNRVNSVTPD